MNISRINENWDVVYNYVNDLKLKHFSFDFWNTIAYSNPEFKEKRAELLLRFINKNTDASIVKIAFSEIGKEYNLNQESGIELVSSIDLLSRVLNKLNSSISGAELSFLKTQLDSLFLKYPPLIDNNLYDIVELIIKSGKTSSITSNTAFISGNIIREFLSNVELLNKFSFCLFSDNVGFAKPGSKIYEQLYSEVGKKQPSLKKSEIIHFGDNEVADHCGAMNFGFKAFRFKSQLQLTNNRHAVYSIVDSALIPFQPDEYSKFKFGDTHIAKKYGIQLFEYFLKNLLPGLITKYNNFLIYSSPFSRIPTSSYYLTEAFCEAFNNYLNEDDTKEINMKFCKIRRCQTYTEDYGALDAEKRYNLIKNDTYAFVDIPSYDGVSIFIDDISITGTHQRVIEKLLEDNMIKTNSLFLYYAKLSNPEVCPSFENTLNYSFTSDVVKLMEILLSNSYKITTRTTKYILSLKSNDLEYLISKIKHHKKQSIISELVEKAYANDYDDILIYKQNLKILESLVPITNNNKS